MCFAISKCSISEILVRSASKKERGRRPRSPATPPDVFSIFHGEEAPEARVGPRSRFSFISAYKGEEAGAVLKALQIITKWSTKFRLALAAVIISLVLSGNVLSVSAHEKGTEEKAKKATEIKKTENEENEDGTARIEIIKGRHPTLDAKMVDKFVPNSASLGGAQPPGESSENNLTPRRRRAMILTGPNMGGKSCFARQVALIAILAHIGSFVPAQSCRLSVLDGIYTRAGAADNLALGQSTFFQEMSETSAILKSCSKKSLVVLDELGRGTSTSDGIALATATLRMLVEKVQCATVFVTHFSNLAKQFKESNADEVFCCFPGHVKTSDEKDSKRITFLYTLEEGVAHRSFGLNVASMAGIPERVLEVAEVKSLAFEESSTRKSVRNDAEEVDKMVRDALSLESSNIAKIEETQRALRLRL